MTNEPFTGLSAGWLFIGGLLALAGIVVGVWRVWG